MKSYEKDWSDLSRDLANAFFLIGYMLLMLDRTVWGASVYLVAECFLMPHSIRCRSWSTIIVSLIFTVASICKVVNAFR